MTAPAFTPAQKAAALIVTQTLSLQVQIKQQCDRLEGMIAKGIPAQGSNPAVSSADLQKALDSNLTSVQAILAALKAAVPSS